MLQGKTVAVVVPAYNEEKQIGMVIESMPEFVDRIVVVNDKSKDFTAKIVERYLAETKHGDTPPIKRIPFLSKGSCYERACDVHHQEIEKESAYFTPSEVANTNQDTDRIILINHLENGGVGAAIATGYLWCRDHAIDCTAVMAGDGQMDPAELSGLCLPVITEGVDYVKGNRLIHPSAVLMIPKVRYFGNSVLSILTKIASGYWHISDTQTGYTAISLKALRSVRLHEIYKSYGMPNDMLVKLNIGFCTLREIEIKPVYNVGEHSKMKIWKVIPRISFLLLRSFFIRLYKKYFWRDFHPLFLFYNFAFLILLCSVPYGIKVFQALIKGTTVSELPVLAFMFLFITGGQFLIFAMWMDIQDNERLNK